MLYITLDYHLEIADGEWFYSGGFIGVNGRNAEQSEIWKAKRSYSMFKVRRGGREEIPVIQGKEQWLCFAGVAVKRYTTSKVRKTQVRW